MRFHKMMKMRYISGWEWSIGPGCILEHMSQSNLTLRTPKMSKFDIFTQKSGPDFKKGAPDGSETYITP